MEFWHRSRLPGVVDDGAANGQTAAPATAFLPSGRRSLTVNLVALPVKFREQPRR